MSDHFCRVFSIVIRVLVIGWLSVVAADSWAVITAKPPLITARAFLLVDFNSDAVLMEKGIFERMEPASLTKMMTAYVVFSELKQGRLALSDEVLVSKKAWKTGGSRMFIEVGTRVSVEDLLRGLIIQSGNDASVALAEHIASDESLFADMMNRHAQRLGAIKSQFVNSSGLPHPDHYTTVRDMAIVAQALIRDFPEYYPMHSEKSFTYNDISQPNRNRLLRTNLNVDGLKTGYTKSAGYCLVASAKRQDMRLIAIVMGAKSSGLRQRQVRAMLNYGYRFYETRRLYPADESVTEVRLWKGEEEELRVGLAKALVLTIPRGQYQNIDTKMELQTPIIAPVGRGDTLGKLRIQLDDLVLAERDLVAIHAVAKGGLWRQLGDHVRLWFE